MYLSVPSLLSVESSNCPGVHTVSSLLPRPPHQVDKELLADIETLTVKLKASEVLVHEREEEVKMLSAEMESLKAENGRSEERRLELEGIADQLREKHVSCLLERFDITGKIEVRSMVEFGLVHSGVFSDESFSNYERRLEAISVEMLWVVVGQVHQRLVHILR